MSTYLNKYKLLKTLGSGGYSKVKLAEDPDTGRHYAIKILKSGNEDQNKKILEMVITEV